MGNQKEIYMDENIRKYVDLVFGRTYFQLSTSLKEFIQRGIIQVDYNTRDSNDYFPFYDCLYYPLVSDTKCSQEYDAADWQKLELEIGKYSGINFPTYEVYSIRRLINELGYFLKLIFQAAISPQEFPDKFGFDSFINQYQFLYKHYPNINEKELIRSFFTDVIEGLKNDVSFNKMGFDGKFYPLGTFAVGHLNWLQEKIQDIT